MFKFRENTMDRYVFHQVVGMNEYRLDESLDGATVVDIGAHIGSFGYAALLRGAHKLVLFEAEKENFDLCMQNLASFTEFASIQGYNLAVWRSDVVPGTIRHTGHPIVNGKVANTGGGNVLWDDGEHIEVNFIGLDSVIESLEYVDLLKIDAETSEFPILYTATKLNKVKNIVGEFHEVGGKFNTNYVPEHAQVLGKTQFLVEELKSHLELQGFTFRYNRFPNSNMGLFWASKV